MQIPALQQLTTHVGPFVSVSMDVSRNDERAVSEVQVRWQDLERKLTSAGAPAEVLSRIGEVVVEPTGEPGHQGRLVIADRDGIALNLVLPARPTRNEAFYGPAPHVLPAFRALAETVPYLLASIDRTGADITVVDALGASVDTVEVQGSHDVVHKVAGGQMSGRRIQARAEDSWERNAAEVARELEELISRHHPAVVLLDGDAVAVSNLLDAAAGRLKELAVRLKYGGRGSGASTKSRDAEIAGVLVGQRRSANAALMDRFGTEEGRQEAAVQGLESVVDAARRAQIGELLLHDDPSSTRTLWLGPGAGELGTTEEEVRSIGAADAVKVRADTALVWTVLSTDAGVTLLDPDDRALSDGIGALLRWSDRSTPHDAIPSMPGHGAVQGAHHRGG